MNEIKGNSIQRQNSAMPAATLPQGQIGDQLDQLGYALDALYETVQALLRRMEPVAGCLQIPVGTDLVGDKQSALVPVAYRIAGAAERVRSNSADLDRILSNIQI